MTCLISPLLSLQQFVCNAHDVVPASVTSRSTPPHHSSPAPCCSGGADVTFPTVDAWLSTFDAPATDLSLKLGPAGFVPINHALAAKPVLTAPPPPPAIAASASATPAGTNATVGGRYCLIPSDVSQLLVIDTPLCCCCCPRSVGCAVYAGTNASSAGRRLLKAL